MAGLTSTVRGTLAWLTPGLWQESNLSAGRGLRELFVLHPELCEQRVVETARGLVTQYRLTPAGEAERASLV